MEFVDQLVSRLDAVYRKVFGLGRKDSAIDVFYSVAQVKEDGEVIIDYNRLGYIFNNRRNFQRFAQAVEAINHEDNTIPPYMEYIGEDGLEDYLIIQLVEEFDVDDVDEGVELYTEAIDRNIIYVSDLQEQVITASEQTRREFFDELMEGRYNIDTEYELPEEDPGRDLIDTYWEFAEITEATDLQNIVDELEELAPQLERAQRLEEIYDENGVELDSGTFNKIRKLVIHEDEAYSNQGIELAHSFGGISNDVDIYIRPLRERVEKLREDEQESAQDAFDTLLERYRRYIEQDWDNDWHWQPKDELEGYWNMLDHETNLQEIAESDFYQDQWKEKSSFSYNRVLKVHQRPLYSLDSPRQLQLFR